MIPIVTPAEMAEVDALATEPVEHLIERAGAAVAWAVRRRLGGLYGRRVAVLAGPGNNGADGRVAARRLESWGARVAVLDPAVAEVSGDVDLVVDAAYGTGLKRPYRPPSVSAPVLAVDIASGVDGLTGAISGGALAAVETVTFQALKPGLVLHPGAANAGRIHVVDLGLDVSGARTHLLEANDVAGLVPRRAADAHKWQAACWVIAGSAGMTGAAHLAAAAAARGGAGYVRLSVPGADGSVGPIEAVGHHLPATGWFASLQDVDRFAALVIGPGLGRDPGTAAEIVRLAGVDVPMVLDGDALAALAGQFDVLRSRRVPAVLTPHDGEYGLLTGARPEADRIHACRALAADTGAVVLLKGPATVIAEPGGAALVVDTGDERLASAGTGDVLAGLIGSLLCQGALPFDAAAAGAWIHGRSATSGPARGMVASDLLTALPEVLDAPDLG